MITREQYNKALDIVEKYHIQLKLECDFEPKKTEINDLIYKEDISVRLRNSLRNYMIMEKNIEKIYIEEVNIKQLRRIRGAGKKSIDEFIKLRGY